MPNDSSSRRRLLIVLVLALATLAVHGAVLRNGFVNYDDDLYVTKNAWVRAGPTIEGLRWALTTGEGANWHPLTWLSHMLDCRLYGLDPRGHHGTSLLLHLSSVLLLFLVFDRMTHETAKSAVVAALFGIHPLHVESVAWIAERKDVLSGLFFMLCLLAYGAYAAAPSRPRYAAVLATFSVGLLAKPMLVTLPFVLLLLDFWPLGRFSSARSRRVAVLEKLPLLALSAVSSAVTLLAESRGGAVGSAVQYPFPTRIANALVALVVYLRRTLWPSDLAVFYPYPAAGIPAWKTLGAAFSLAAITIAALASARRRPYLTVGWLWYVGTLVPVLGLVQVGEQSSADRYTYIPLVGIFVAAVWGTAEIALGSARASSRTKHIAAAVATALVLFAFGLTARVQTRFWHDSIRLFERSLAVTEDNDVAHLNLALAFEEKGDLSRAIEHYQSALAIRKDHPVAHNNLGRLLTLQGKGDQARAHLAAALAASPGYADAHDNLGVALAREGRLDEAVAHFREAVRLRPAEPTFLYDWGTALAAGKRWKEAAERFREAIRLRPDYAEAHRNLAGALYFTGDLETARQELDLARRLGYAASPDLVRMLSSSAGP